ncbi:MAG: M61 family metallopeptidase [Blastocatellia bacterium]|nr:M61 family metallopeptidase [Blastocatellia bacterium]
MTFLVISNLPVSSASDDTESEVPVSEPLEKLKIDYTIDATDTKNHLYKVTIQVSGHRSHKLDFAMPAWSPGRYVIFDFAKNLQDFQAKNRKGDELKFEKLDKQTWRVECQPNTPFEVSYKVYANDLSGTFSQLNDTHANYNGASIFMYVASHKQDPIRLTVVKPSKWKIWSGASSNSDQTEFLFDNYDLLVDAPFEIANFDNSDFRFESFTHEGKTYRIVLHHFSDFDEWDRLVESTKKIVKTQTAIVGQPDFEHYTFLLHFVPPSSLTSDGMEHLNSTQIIENSLDYLLGTISHEFFHLWNVKRLRPVELGPWDYSHEVHTKSLWIAEGLTSYYGDLALARSGVWSNEKFYKAMSDEIYQLQNRAGRQKMSLELSSWDTWLYLAVPKAQATNQPNTTVSYYNKGEIVGMLLDFEIRHRTAGRKSLDDVFRYMYNKFYLNSSKETYYLKGRGYKTEDFLKAVNTVSGNDFADFFKIYVSGTEELDYNRYLAYAGLEIEMRGNSYQIKENPSASRGQKVFREAWLTGKNIAVASK